MIKVSSEAAERIHFYDASYDTLHFLKLNLDKNARPLVLGSKQKKCRFCGGEPPRSTFKKTAHAVSELLGNKLVRTLYECDACNDRFKVFENDLGHATLPIRNTGAVRGKGGIPTLKSRSGKSNIQFLEDGRPAFNIREDDEDVKIDKKSGRLEFTYFQPAYRPLGAYKALCKAAVSMISPEELLNFSELLTWLKEPDLTTYRVYGEGNHLCLSSFVPAFRPFRQSILVLLRRKKDGLEVPYLSLVIAFGNVSFQIFPPCPKRDKHLIGKTSSLVRYPHLFDLQPWLTPRPPIYSHDEWTADARVGGPKTLSWNFDAVRDPQGE